MQYYEIAIALGEPSPILKRYPIANNVYVVEFVNAPVGVTIRLDNNNSADWESYYQSTGVKASFEKSELYNHTDIKALTYGADMVDPNSATNEPIADSTADVDTIRQQQGKARARMHWGKRNGSDGGSPATPGSKSRNNAAQKVEEDLAEEVVKIGIEIEQGLITTTSQIDSRINAIDLKY